MKNQGVAQTLLDHYRDSLSPSQQTRERMLREVTLRIASGSAPAIRLDTPPETPTDVVQAGPVAAGATNPWVVAAVAAGAAVLLGLGALWWRERTHEPTPSPLPAAQPAAPAPETIEPALPPGQVVQPAPHMAPAAPAKTNPRSGQPRSSNTRRSKAVASDGLAALAPAEPPPAPAPAPAEASKPAVAPQPAPEDPKPAIAPQPPASASVPAPSAAERDQLAEELRLIRAAYAALQANKPDAALARVEEHAKKFPSGKLAESRDVARIMALCQSGKIEQGRAESARFLARSPGSAYASRVKTLCVEPSSSH